jgi:hypothetical protein
LSLAENRVLFQEIDWMSNSFRAWLGQVTTGHGFMILTPTLIAALSGQMSWSTAAPLMAAGLIGLAWPENTALQTAGQTVASDVAGLVNTFMNKGNTKPST